LLLISQSSRSDGDPCNESGLILTSNLQHEPLVDEGLSYFVTFYYVLNNIIDKIFEGMPRKVAKLKAHKLALVG